jgi:hypothetical protein
MNLKAGWIVFLVACACSRPPADHASVTPDPSEDPWFQEIDLGAAGAWRHSTALDGEFSMPENLGPGIGVLDYDNDGDLDLYVVDGGNASKATPNRLLRQEADGSFVDVTDRARVGDGGYGMGVATADIEGDGDLDLYVTNFGPDRLFINNGDGSFSKGSLPEAVESAMWSSSAAFCDSDLDGLPDLFVATYVDYQPTRACTDRAGRREYCGPSVFAAVPDVLLRNLGGGSFVDVSSEVGLSDVASRGLGVICHDLDGDGFPDVFVANDGEENDLWMNHGDGTFSEQALLMGTATDSLGKPEASMGVAVGDVDGDLDLDILLSHLDRESNTLYRNLGSAGFQDVTADFGMGSVSLPFTGFGAVFLDPDLDGDLDLLLANGKVRRGATPVTEDVLTRATQAAVPDMLREYAESNLFLENIDGRFENSCTKAPSFCSRVEVGRGLVSGDINLDGKPDLILANCAGPLRLFLNSNPGAGNWLSVRAVRASGSQVLGSNIRVQTPLSEQLRPVLSSYSYQSTADPTAHFGLGSTTAIESLEVEWPGGSSLRMVGLPANRRVHIYRDSPAAP